MDAYERAVAEQLDRAYEQLLPINPVAAANLRNQSFQLYLSDPESVIQRGVYCCGLKPYGFKRPTGLVIKRKL